MVASEDTPVYLDFDARLMEALVSQVLAVLLPLCIRTTASQ